MLQLTGGVCQRVFTLPDLTTGVMDDAHGVTVSPTVPQDETTPLLRPIPDAAKRPRTPLPKLQIAIVIFLQIGEPLLSQSIYPYINQVCPIRDDVRWHISIQRICVAHPRVGHYWGRRQESGLLCRLDCESPLKYDATGGSPKVL